MEMYEGDLWHQQQRTLGLTSVVITREILQPLPATARSLLEAEVPAVKRRTSCVHADLVQLAKALGRIAA